jgi:dTDP-glucose 4,6-dehydratase
MRVLVTGVYGFIGSQFAKLAIDKGWEVVGFARNTDQKNILRIKDIEDNENFKLVLGDLTGDISGLVENIDAVVNFAAKTFVDHSIRDPKPFVYSNLVGTYNLLEQSRLYKAPLYFQISTDEVYGAILKGSYKEDARLNPTNPYSATKAAADVLAISYYNTYGLPVLITRTENNYGPMQHPQKVLPVFVKKALADEELPVYGDGKHRRMWLHVEDHCEAVAFLIERFFEGKVKAGEIFHVAGEQELENLELAKIVLKTLGKPVDRIKFIDDMNIRPGHDRRYALDTTKLRNVGWEPKISLDEGLKTTVNWYKDNKWWFK